MEIVQKMPDLLILRMDANESLANAIRRSVAEVPVLAIDEVEIYKNDSALYDEVLSHRLGLVPFKTEKGVSSKTSVELKLSKIGPCTIYASDLKGAAEPVFGKTPIVYLGEDHKLELLAKLSLGKGIIHAKYIPGLCYYRHMLEVKSSPEIDLIVEKSKSSFKPEQKGNKWLCDLNDSEIEKVMKIDKDAVKDSSEMLLFIESYGNMPAKDVLAKAIESFEKNLEEFEKSLK